MANAKRKQRPFSHVGKSAKPPSPVGDPPIVQDSLPPESTDAPSESVTTLDSWLLSANTNSLKSGDSSQLVNAVSSLTNWRSDQITVSHLLAEIRSGTSEVTKLMILIWAKDAQVHRLARLADEIIGHEGDLLMPPESMLVIAELCQFLGIMRTDRAKKLNQILYSKILPTGSTQSPESVMNALSESEKWAQAGILLESSSPADRLFWNNRLRNPEMTWNWEDIEAREALSSASKFLPNAPISIQELYQKAVPESWWDLFSNTRLIPGTTATTPSRRLQYANSTQKNAFTLGLLKITALLVIGALIGSVLTAKIPPTQEALPLPKSAVQTHVTPLPSPESPTPTPLASPRPSPPKPTSWRIQEITSIQSQYPALERLHRILRNETLKEAEPTLKGGSLIASLRTPSYNALLRWALVDPPQDAAVRRAVIRLFTLTLPLSESLPILERASRPGEPYQEEMQEMARIVLSARPVPLTPEQVERLRKIAE